MNDPTYARARELLERFAQRDNRAHVGELGRTLVFDHGSRTQRATLLLHGLSASPRQLIAVAESLYARGHNVFVPRLPRHGHHNRLSEGLATMSAAQLEACAADSLEVTRALGEHVTVAGFSLGGLLSAYIGQTHRVDRIVALSPFLGIAAVPNIFRLRIAKWILRRPNRFYWWNPFRRERMFPEHGYPRFATHAIAHGLTLAHEVLDTAERNAPRADELTIVINPRDSTVNRKAIERLARYWTARKGPAVRVHRLTGMPPFVHDIVEPKRHPALAKRIASELVELIDR